MATLELSDTHRSITIESAVPDLWALREFAPHRPLRSKLVDMVRRNGLTRVVVDWPG